MSFKSKIRDVGALVLFVVISNAAGIIGSLFTRSAIEGWYTTLVRPELAPPNWVFAPVWTTLYTLMGVSAFLIWRYSHTRQYRNVALSVFFVHLAVNAFWSIAFFGMQNLALALGVIVALLVLIVSVMILFYRVSKWAAYLLVPYLAWVSFATYLNYSFWILN